MMMMMMMMTTTTTMMMSQSKQKVNDVNDVADYLIYPQQQLPPGLLHS